MSRILKICKRSSKQFSIASSRDQGNRGTYCSMPCRFPLSFLPEEAFWLQVKKGGENDCWPWIGLTDSNGYGLFDRDGKRHVASRRAFELTNGLLPDNIYACHTCDNPPCCNPKHLVPGTQEDNMMDCVRKGRSTRGGRNRHSVLYDLDVLLIWYWYGSRRFTQSQLYKGFGVSPSTIHNIVRDKTWTHLISVGDLLEKTSSAILKT